MCAHVARYSLRDEEAAAQIGVEDQIPVVPCDVERGLADIASRVVDEDVNLLERSFGFSGHALDAGMVAHIEFQRQRATAEGADFRFEFGEGFAATAGEDQVGSGFGERACDVLAKPPAGAGNESNLPGEVKERIAHAALSGRGVSTIFIRFGSCA